MLAMAAEYLRTNHTQLADQYLVQAEALCPTDPAVHHERGLWAFRTGDYVHAVASWEHCLALTPPERRLPQWEATYINLGHACRKLERFAEAISCFTRALISTPHNVGVLTSLGFTYHRIGKTNDAIDCYHKVLNDSCHRIPRDPHHY
jgi:anaphase-promoting complex subunit 6